jgi:hypothetical protein
METAVIGLPLSGKTTLFNALTGQSAPLSAAPGMPKAANVGDVKVPDERVDRLAAIFHPERRVYAIVRFRDLQTLQQEDGGLPAATIGEMRNSDALTLVVRAFQDDGLPHALGEVDPLRDFRRLLDSLVFSDYAVTDKRIERLLKEGKKGDREHQRLEILRARLEEGKLIGDLFTEDDAKLLSGFAFLTAKPIIVVANSGERSADTSALEATARELGLAFFSLRGDAESEIAQLPDDEQAEFLAEIGRTQSTKARFLATIYAALNLESFLTVGEDEVRAWSIRRGTRASEAAGTIHTDLQKGFIRAEVVHYTELLEAGGLKEAKTAGRLRLEGKDYTVKDGDVLNIRFNL